MHHFQKRLRDLIVSSGLPGTSKVELKKDISSLLVEIDKSLEELPVERKETISSLAIHLNEATTRIKGAVSGEIPPEYAKWLQVMNKKTRDFIFKAATLHAGSAEAEAFYTMHMKFVEKADTEDYFDTMYWRAVAQARGGRFSAAKFEFEKLYEDALEFDNKQQQARIMNARTISMEWEEKIPFLQETLLISLESRNSEFVFVTLNNLIRTCISTLAYEEVLKLVELFEHLYYFLPGNTDETSNEREIISDQDKLIRIGALIKWCFTELQNKDGGKINSSSLEKSSLFNNLESETEAAKKVINSIKNTTKEEQGNRCKDVKSRRIKANLELGQFDNYFVIDNDTGEITETEAFKNDASIDDIRSFHFLLGEHLGRQDEHEKALEHALTQHKSTEIKRNFNRDIDYAVVYARSLIFCNKIEEAITLLKKSLGRLHRTKASEMQKISLVCELCYAYILQKRFGEAERVILKYEPHLKEKIGLKGKILYGIIHFKNGNIEEARIMYEKVMEEEGRILERQTSMIYERRLMWHYLKQLKSMLEQ
jgi:tetratricopeptide (TPR) repeat protein